jgi:alpha-1,6-mannosyltransferase
MKINFQWRYLPVLISFLGYFSIGYFVPRENYILYFSAYFMLFASFLFLINQKLNLFSLKTLIGLALFFRLIFLFCHPALSDDYYRFIWDGQLLSHGMNPFSNLPRDIYPGSTSGIPLADTLYSHLNALQKSNYTCYPPFNQVFFYLAALLFPKYLFGNILILRLFILLAETGTIFYGMNTLKLLGKSEKNILLFALNPLVIIELTGNLHFEGVMIFFLVLSLYFWVKNRNTVAALVLGLSASVKLVTLIVFPFFIEKFRLRDKIIFITVSITSFILLFLPILLLNQQGSFFSSLELYFNNFQFNSSILSLLRQSLLRLSGRDLVYVFGPLLSIISFLIITMIFLLRENKHKLIAIESFLFALTTYYFLATTVHPWYITTLVILAVFTRFRYPVAWSLMVILSYRAYSNYAFNENYVLIILEYAVVYSFFLFEIFGLPGKAIKLSKRFYP